MNHDYAHCADYTESCPKDCFRAQLVRELHDTHSIMIVSWMHLKGTEECSKGEKVIMDDLISRQAAIDIAKELIITLDGYEQHNQAVNNYCAEIMQLPPAQPEIIRCKDCKYGILYGEFPHQRFCSFNGNEWNDDDYYCGHAKREEMTA